MINRRIFLQQASASLLLSCMSLPSRAAQIVAVRVWPAQDYTRVTLESEGDLKVKHFMLSNPLRLAVEIESVEMNHAVRELSTKVLPNDPYIAQVRAAQNRAGVVRLVFDLKEDINPQIFILPEVGIYKKRLVLDLYPAHPTDPLMKLVREYEKRQPAIASNAGKPHTPPDKPPESKKEPQVETGADKKSPAKTQAGVKSSVPTAKKMTLPIVTIALDPGHGGEDPGAIGAQGSFEKNIVLAIAQKLKEKMDTHATLRAMLTREGDYFVPLAERVKKARAVNADLFVSIHADAFIRPEARGSSVFILSPKGASSTAAKWLADKENLADLIGGVNLNRKDPELARMLLDLSTTAQMKDSNIAAKAVLQQIGKINALHKGMVEQAGFAVLKSPEIPSLLIETAFISNPEEEEKLNDESYQDQIASAILKGIQHYFDLHPPLNRRNNHAKS